VESTTPARLVGIGVGPGDPELLTVRALRVLREADVVFAPAMEGDVAGRAESIVAAALPDLVMERLTFAIGVDEGRRTAAYEAAADRVVATLDALDGTCSGGTVAFVTLGDPHVYSTFTGLARAVAARRPDVGIETVPGIMAFQELAARSGVVVLEGSERLLLVSLAEGPAALEGAFDDARTAVVVYKGGRHLPAVAARLAEAGRDGGAVVGELLGLPGQHIRTLAGEPEPEPAGYLATVIAPPKGRQATP
jgi:precorrin-2/cobalt-factor-2 C20-methyltransferase